MRTVLFLIALTCVGCAADPARLATLTENGRTVGVARACGGDWQSLAAVRSALEEDATRDGIRAAEFERAYRTGYLDGVQTPLGGPGCSGMQHGLDALADRLAGSAELTPMLLTEAKFAGTTLGRVRRCRVDRDRLAQDRAAVEATLAQRASDGAREAVLQQLAEYELKDDRPLVGAPDTACPLEEGALRLIEAQYRGVPFSAPASARVE